MTINRSHRFYHSLPLPSVQWQPAFRIFYPTPATGTTYAERTRDLASRFKSWVWVSPSEVEVVP